MSNIVINIQNLNKEFDNFKAVDNLDIQVKETECVGLLGPNGAGKTTTMKMLYGKLRPTENAKTLMDVFGYDPRKQSLEIKFLSGIVPQQDNLDLNLNVEDNLKIYSKFYGIAKKEAQNRINELLSFMELQEKNKSLVKELSGGMQRRLTIARSLINQPSLLFLDEPTTGLDPQVRHLIWNKLRALKSTGTTMLLTTHYMEEAYQICDTIIIMDKGKKLLEGSPKQLMDQNIEKHVIQIHEECKDKNAVISYLSGAGIRFEFFNESLFVYSNEYEKLHSFATKLQYEDYDIRRSNLEDLFLKVTGRSLNELQ